LRWLLLAASNLPRHLQAESDEAELENLQALKIDGSEHPEKERLSR